MLNKIKDWVIPAQAGIQATQTLKYLGQFIILIVSLLYLSACSDNNAKKIPNRAMVTSVSSNGEYAFTTNSDRNAYLWNIKDKTYQKINHGFPVNIYSAYFIPNTNLFMYQNDKTNEVIIENVNGKVIKTFQVNFPVYGEAITSDLDTWVASDKDFRLFFRKNGKQEKILYHWCGPDYHQPKPPKGSYYTCSGFLSGQLPNIHFAPNETYFVTNDGLNSLFIWNTNSGELMKLISKNVSQTSNAIAPNGNYIITGDQEGIGNIYDLTEKKSEPFIYKMDNADRTQGISQLAFIDQNQFLSFWWSVGQPYMYATLSNINDLKKYKKQQPGWINNYLTPMKYLPLVKNPNAQYPSDNGLYPQTQSFLPVVATSPSAHILVMAQANGGGIMVYQYHPEKQTLKLIWAPQLK